MGIPFQVDAQRTGAGSYVVTLSGELDHATAPELEATLSGACAAGASSIVVDLTGVTFMGSVGLRILLRASERCSRSGCRYQVGGKPSPAVRRVFEITGIDETRLTFEPQTLVAEPALAR